MAVLIVDRQPHYCAIMSWKKPVSDNYIQPTTVRISLIETHQGCWKTYKEEQCQATCKLIIPPFAFSVQAQHRALLGGGHPDSFKPQKNKRKTPHMYQKWAPTQEEIKSYIVAPSILCFLLRGLYIDWPVFLFRSPLNFPFPSKSNQSIENHGY